MFWWLVSSLARNLNDVEWWQPLVTACLAWTYYLWHLGHIFLALESPSNLSLALVRRQNSFPHCAADMPRQAAQNHQDRILFGREKQGQAISQDQNPIRHSLSCRRDSSVQEIASSAAISSNSNEIRIRPTHRSPFSSRKALKGRLDVSSGGSNSHIVRQGNYVTDGMEPR